MSFQKVCRVCNKFLKDTKRSNAFYCGKSCKNKALALRKSESVLKSPQIAKTITPDNPLYGAPNIYDLLQRTHEIRLQFLEIQSNEKHRWEKHYLDEKIRKLELAETNRKQENINKFIEKGLFVFTDFIEKKVKSQSDLISKKIKPQSGFMPLTADDFPDF